MPEKFSNISRDEFELNQSERGNVNYRFHYFKNLKVDNFDLGFFYDLVLEYKNNSEARDVYLKHEIDILDLLNQNSGLGIEIGGPTIGGYNFFNIKFDSQNQINGFKRLDLFKEYSKKNKIFISNVLPQDFDFIQDENGDNIVLGQKPDFIADGSIMPLKNNQINVIFASNIGNISYNLLIKLKNKGLNIPQEILESAKKIEKDLEYKLPQERIDYQINKRNELRNLILKEIKRISKDKGILIWNGLYKEDLLSSLELGFDIAQIEYYSYLDNNKRITNPDKAIFIINKN